MSFRAVEAPRGGAHATGVFSVKYFEALQAVAEQFGVTVSKYFGPGGSYTTEQNYSHWLQRDQVYGVINGGDQQDLKPVYDAAHNLIAQNLAQLVGGESDSTE